MIATLTGNRHGMLQIAGKTAFRGAVVLGGMALLSLPVSDARADIFNKWMQFGGSSGGGGGMDRYEARRHEINPPKGYATLNRSNIKHLKNAIARYRKIVKKGGWKPLPRVKSLSAGSDGPVVKRLIRRLELTGDIKPGASYYDYYVERGVKRFQLRHGLTPSGVVDRKTVMALNVSAKARLRQLRLNLSRLSRWSTNAKKYIMVNIPAAQVEAVQNGRVVSRHAGVVGKIDRPTPIVRSWVEVVSFNPYWTVPPTVLKEDLVPKARKLAKRGKDILSVYHMTAYAPNGRKLNPKKINWFSNAVYNYTYRQDPYEDNSMGFVKIRFPNAYSVYLHDTPSKSLFGRNFRAQSSGCVRVSNIDKLVAWILKNDGWNKGRVASIKKSGEQADARPKRKIPLYLAYVTAWATPDGRVHFRRDIYKRDGVGVKAASY